MTFTVKKPQSSAAFGVEVPVGIGVDTSVGVGVGVSVGVGVTVGSMQPEVTVTFSDVEVSQVMKNTPLPRGTINCTPGIYPGGSGPIGVAGMSPEATGVDGSEASNTCTNTFDGALRSLTTRMRASVSVLHSANRRSGRRSGVRVDVGVDDGVLVAVGVGVTVGVNVGVTKGVLVGVPVRVGVPVLVGVLVLVGVIVRVGVLVIVGVLVGVGVLVKV